ncbi:MAG: long-chain fatty acid--CoA ligase [Rubrivivax sp.]
MVLDAARPAALSTAPHARHWPRRLPRELAIPATTLWFNLEVAAARFPDKAAYRFFGRTLDFATLKARAEALAGWLQAAGLEPGGRVILYLQNCPQWAVAFYGILRAGGVVVPVNPMNKADELGHYITDPGARFAVTSRDLAAWLHEADQRLRPAQRLRGMLVARLADAMPDEPVPEESPAPAVLDWLRDASPLPPGATAWAEALAGGHRPGPAVGGPDDLAVLPYTSGTTGLPKGCMHTHRSLMANTVGGVWAHAGPETVSLGVVPMFHITGLVYTVLASVYQGSTVVLLPRWDRELAARLIARHRITHWTCIPTMIVDLLASPELDRMDLSSLRYLSGGGAAMPQAVAERLRERFGLSFAEGYGLTETAAPSHANPPERAKLQCLGMPIFGVDSRVIDPETLRELPPGEPGEIVTRGPMLFRGYWGHPEATRAAFVELDGQAFFRTGDMGRVDEEGYFFMTDRLKRMINASGFKVWPSEVELMLYRCPAVQEACVIAAKDAYRGETVKAVVVLRPEARGTTTAEDITAWAREHMAAYKVPRIVEFVDALPRSGSGKVLWRLLQEREA